MICAWQKDLITPIFNAIELLEEYEEYDAICSKLKSILQRNFKKISAAKTENYYYAKQWKSMIYYPTGLVYDKFSKKSIILRPYDAPSPEKIIENEKIVALKQLKRKIKSEIKNEGTCKNFQASYKYVELSSIPLRFLILSLINKTHYMIDKGNTYRWYSQYYKYRNDLFWYEIANKYKRFLDLPSSTQHCAMQNLSSLNLSLNMTVHRIFYFLFGLNPPYHLKRNKSLYLLNEEAAYQVMRTYIIIGKRDINLNYEDKNRIIKVINYVQKDPKFRIETNLTINDFMYFEQTPTDDGKAAILKATPFNFSVFYKKGYPKLLKLAESHDFIKILLENLHVIEPVSKAEGAKRKKVRQAKLHAALYGIEIDASNTSDKKVADIHS